MKDYKQKRDVINLDDLPDNAIIVVTTEGTERVLGKRELLTAIERGLRPSVDQPAISKAQESARIRYILGTIEEGDIGCQLQDRRALWSGWSLPPCPSPLRSKADDGGTESQGPSQGKRWACSTS